MKDKMKTKNYDMRVLKWNRVWNDDRKRKIERERQSNGWYIPAGCCDCDRVIEESRATNIAKKKLSLQYLSWYHFLKKNKIRDYFYRISWTSYEFEWL